MITQEQIKRLNELQFGEAEMKDLKAKLEKQIVDGEAMEPGPLTLQWRSQPTSNTSYKPVVEWVKENHPELVGPITVKVASVTKSGKDAYTFTVKPTPFATE